jgi:hypothetical protein
MPNYRSSSSSSTSTTHAVKPPSTSNSNHQINHHQNNTNSYDMILNESDSILNDLNDIIDSQMNVKQKKKSTSGGNSQFSFKIKPSTITASNVSGSSSMSNFQLKDFELKMPKFKSYLLNKSSLSSHMNSSFESNEAYNGSKHATTISGVKIVTKKSHQSSKAAQKSSVNDISLAGTNTTSSSSTCVINNSKKKRSSLFNLFSFKNLSRDSSMSNSQTSIQNSILNLNQQAVKSNEKYEKKKFNEFHLVNLKKTPSTPPPPPPPLHYEHDNSNNNIRHHYCQQNDECIEMEETSSLTTDLQPCCYDYLDASNNTMDSWVKVFTY